MKAIKGLEKKERTKRKESENRENKKSCCKYFERLKIVHFNSQWQKPRKQSSQNLNAMKK